MSVSLCSQSNARKHVPRVQHTLDRTYEAIRGEAAICSPFSRLNELVALEALIHEELECDLAVLMDLQRAQKLHNHP